MGRRKMVRFTHTLRLSEEAGLETKTNELIENLSNFKKIYGASCVDSLVKKLLINMSLEELAAEVSGRMPISAKSVLDDLPVASNATVQSGFTDSFAVDDEAGLDDFAPG